MPAKRKLDTLSIVAWVKTQLQLKADGRPYTTTLADAAQALDYADGVGVKTALERAVRETAGLPDDNAGKITAADLQSLFPQMGQEQRQPASVAEIVAYVQDELRRKKANPNYTATLTTAAAHLNYSGHVGVKPALERAVRETAGLQDGNPGKITVDDLQSLFPGMGRVLRKPASVAEIVAYVQGELRRKKADPNHTTTLTEAAQALDYAHSTALRRALERAVQDTAHLPDGDAGKITAADLQFLFPQMGLERREPASVAEIVAYVQGELRRKKADPKHTTTLTNAAKALDYADSTGVKNALMRVVRYSASLPMDKKITIADLEYLFPATNWRKAVDKPIDSATLASLRRMLLPLSEIAQELDVPIRRLQAADFDRVPSNTEQYPEAMQTNRSITKQEILDGCIAHQSIICFALAQKIPPIIFLARIGRYARGKDGPQFLDRLPEACRRELAMGQALANWDEIVQGKDLLLPKTCPLALLYAYHTTLNGGVVTTQEALADKIGLPPAQAMQHWNTLAASGLLPPTRPPTAAQLATQRDLVRQ